VRAPADEVLPADVLCPVEDKEPVSPRGRPVVLRLAKPDALAWPGEYRVDLLLEGRPQASGGPAPTLPVRLTLPREKATLDGRRLDGHTVRLVRPFPGCSTGGVVRVYLDNAGGVTARGLTVAGDEVLGGPDQKVLARGRVLVRPGDRPTARDPADGAGAAVDLAPGQRLALDLDFRGFSEAGQFGTALVLRSPSLAGTERVNLRVEVSGFWLCPWLVLFFGVLVAFGVHRAAEWLRPAQENRYRLVRMRGELEGLDRVVALQQRRHQLEDIAELLRRAEERNTLGDPAGAQSQLDQAETALATFRAAEVQQQAAAWQDLERLRREAAGLATRRPQMTPAQAQELDGITAALDDARDRLGVRQVDAARVALDEARAAIQRLTTALGPVPAALAQVVAAPAPDRPVRIRVLGQEGEPTVDNSITFRAELAQRTGHERFCWEFGDGTAEPPSTSAQVGHWFREPGTYVVKVTVEGGAGPLVDGGMAALRVAVLPGRAQRALEDIRHALLLNDLLVSGVALAVASLTGLWALYAGKTFGSLENYLAAFLWGFGTDSGVRGFSEVLKRVRG
jgi:hypothetical protein